MVPGRCEHGRYWAAMDWPTVEELAAESQARVEFPNLYRALNVATEAMAEYEQALARHAQRQGPRAAAGDDDLIYRTFGTRLRVR